MNSGTARVPGVSVSGGTNVVTLPSFGAAPEAHAVGRSNTKTTSNGITVVASSRSGGAMNFYGALKGDRVYTVYIKTAVGTAVMQFADPASTAHPYSEDLSAPQAMRTDLPSDLQQSRLIVACIVDRTGTIKNLRVLQSENTEFESKVLAALASWKFSPAFRGNQAVEVNAILGFGVNTN
jgi:TonB family protein